MTEEEKKLKKLQDGQDDGQTPVVPPVEQAAAAPVEQTPTVTPSPDFARQSLFDAYQNQYNSFADILSAYNEDLKRTQQESEAAQKADIQAARWSNATELASSIANLIGVGRGNAVSQQYSSPSQDWMTRAQEEMRERRSKMDDVRERQRAMQLQMSRLRGEEALQMIKYDQDREARDAEMAYNQARIQYQNAQAEYYAARTEAERQEAEIKLQEADKKLQYVEAQIRAQEALANQRNASASATTKKADAAVSTAANQNENRSSRTEAQNKVDAARTGYWIGRTPVGTGGQTPMVLRQGGQSTPAPAGGSKKTGTWEDELLK